MQGRYLLLELCQLRLSSLTLFHYDLAEYAVSKLHTDILDADLSGDFCFAFHEKHGLHEVDPGLQMMICEFRMPRIDQCIGKLVRGENISCYSY